MRGLLLPIALFKDHLPTRFIVRITSTPIVSILTANLLKYCNSSSASFYLKEEDIFSMKMTTWCLAFVILLVLVITFDSSYGDQIQIPTWIKNTAKWWAQGEIGDSDFVKGIEFLIQQSIIKIPKTETMASTQTHIPKWVQNNAGWWADGSIGDEDFVKGIQYLIQVNIIHINYNTSMILTSFAFANNGTIPSEFTCDGSNVSPPLSISDVPKNAKSLALIMDDPDAPMGTFTHWTLWNIPINKTELSRGEKIDFPQGKTSFGKTGYGGPCPPSGTHRYFFKLYALDEMLDIRDGVTRNQLEQSMNGHIISQAILVGKYSRA